MADLFAVFCWHVPGRFAFAKLGVVGFVSMFLVFAWWEGYDVPLPCHVWRYIFGEQTYIQNDLFSDRETASLKVCFYINVVAKKFEAKRSDPFQTLGFGPTTPESLRQPQHNPCIFISLHH